MDADLAAALAAALGAKVALVDALGGGDINDAARVTLADRRVVFVKHHAHPPAGMFAAEARGLAWLADAHALRVPKVLAHGDRFLALEYLAPAPRVPDFDELLGRGLAHLHAAGAPDFGLDHDNFLATLPQANAPMRDWATFWIERRLRPVARIAIDRGRAPSRWLAAIDRLAAALPALVGPAEPPARLHGDLWSGNVHADDAGAPALIDPAVYGGHREVDLAMLALFGGLSSRTLDAYDETSPLAEGWRDRVLLWQLYPLACHTALFGGGYAAQFERALGRYVADR